MRKDLQLIYGHVKDQKPVSLIRYGDGEMNILADVPCDRKGFKFDPENLHDQIFRENLTEAYMNQEDNYYVGVPNIHDLSGTINMMHSDIFVNANYIPFLDNFIPLFINYKIIFVGNEKAEPEKLPFTIDKFYPIPDTAWHTHLYLHEHILNDLEETKVKTLVLVAGGAFSCTLIYNIWQRNNEHLLLDVGSTFDPFIFGKHTRQYHKRLNNDR